MCFSNILLGVPNFQKDLLDFAEQASLQSLCFGHLWYFALHCSDKVKVLILHSICLLDLFVEELLTFQPP